MSEQEKIKEYQATQLMAYVARCPGCNEIVGVTSDRPEYKRDVAKTVACWIREGCHIERMTADAVRQAWGDGCACEENESESEE